MLASAPILDRAFRKCDHLNRRNNSILVMRTAGTSLGGDPMGNAQEVLQYVKRNMRVAVIILGDEIDVKKVDGRLATFFFWSNVGRQRRNDRQLQDWPPS